MGSYKGKEGKSKPERLRRVPSLYKDPGRKSYRGPEGEAELAKRKRIPSPDNQHKAATHLKDETRSGRRFRPENFTSPDDEWESAFRYSERLNNRIEFVNDVSHQQAVGNERASPETHAKTENRYSKGFNDRPKVVNDILNQREFETERTRHETNATTDVAGTPDTTNGTKQ